MTDARDIVERDHIKETTETLFRIAINAMMPKENEAKWCQALQYAGAMLEKQQADLASLRKQLEDVREVIIEANNSLYGSQGYFLSLDGGPPNKYHLAEGIEKLKSNARRLPKGQRDEVR